MAGKRKLFYVNVFCFFLTWEPTFPYQGDGVCKLRSYTTVVSGRKSRYLGKNIRNCFSKWCDVYDLLMHSSLHNSLKLSILKFHFRFPRNLFSFGWEATTKAIHHFITNKHNFIPLTYKVINRITSHLRTVYTQEPSMHLYEFQNEEHECLERRAGIGCGWPWEVATLTWIFWFRPNEATLIYYRWWRFLVCNLAPSMMIIRYSAR